jgi:hypothetical protein
MPRNKITSPIKNNIPFAGITLACALLLLAACSDSGNNQGMKVTDYPDHQTEAAKLYIVKCGQCHAAPLPTVHPANQWPGIVERMTMRMNNKAIQPPNRQEIAVILGYLQQHASQ